LFDGIYGFMPINGANPRPEGSWEFIHWLATDPTVQAKFFSLGSIPAFAAAQHDSSIANNAAVQLMLNVLTTARVEQPIPYIEQVSTQANAAALDVLNGQGDPATALAKAKQQVDQTIQMETSI
jgi:maltose-binding protein MalE